MNAEDDFEKWLAARPPSDGEPTVDELFGCTRPVLRRRVRIRWLGRTSVALVLLGVGYGLGFETAPTKTMVVEVPSRALAIPEPPAATIPVRPMPEPSAEQLELRAELSDIPADAADLYRKAGDKYLNAERDYARATRCYRMHLRALNQKHPPLNADDSWLLASLKPQLR